MSGSTMGPYLRRIGSGPVEVMLRVQDFTMRADPAKGIGGAGQELVAFVANDFREAGEDVWEFDVVEETADGKRRQLRIGVLGNDIVIVRSESRVAS